MGRWASALLDLALPPGCLTCGTWIPSDADGSLVCGRCLAGLPRAPWPRCPRCHHPRGTGRPEGTDCRMCRKWPPELSFARYAHLLAPPADALVHALKYEGWAELAGPMGAAMARVHIPPPPDPHRRIVIPVPTTSARVRRRGYNQALLLARTVAGALGLPLVEGLARVGEGATQVSLHPSQRRANVRGAFKVREERAPRLKGMHVVLVDDVLTTGATACAAAGALAQGGAGEITLLTYARAIPFLRGGS